MARPKKGEEHPRPELANQIGLLVAIGTPHEQIARMLRIGLDTMHKHYRDDIDLGAARAGAVVGGKIFEAAKRGEHWACALWAARRMGWKETSAQEVSGTNGAPIKVEYGASSKLNGLIDAIAKRSGEAG